MERSAAARIRIDKWLWAARFFKTRSLAAKAVDGGQAKVNGERVKPARELKIGDRLDVTLPDGERTVVVLALSDKRGPAPVARLLYEETPESIAEREKRAQNKAVLAEPASDISGRPTKQARRQLDSMRRRLF